MFTRVWQYEVPDGNIQPFIAAYGPSGDWARLFARERAYLGTALYLEIGTAGRFVTIDRWKDEDGWRSFLGTWHDAYEAMDAALRGLASAQSCLLEGTS